jgi:uncharacterized protein (TIGR02246 family)
MFDRFTEKARRTIFFARYEASQYGSPYIETEHLLLGLLREDRRLTRRLLPTLEQSGPVRDEIEAHIEKRKWIPTSVEVPLTSECKHILKFAVEEADRLGHRHVGNEHLLLGILHEGECFAARILKARGVELLSIRKELARVEPTSRTERGTSWEVVDVRDCVTKLLNTWCAGNAKAFSDWFDKDGVFVDVRGAIWRGRLKIQTGAAPHFTSRATGSTNASIEEFRMLGPQAAVAISVLEPASQESATASGAEKAIEKAEGERIRMTVAFLDNDVEWLVVAAHATRIQSSPSES